MTLIYELDLGILNTCISKMKFVGQGFQKLEQTHRHRQTDATECITSCICEW